MLIHSSGCTDSPTPLPGYTLSCIPTKPSCDMLSRKGYCVCRHTLSGVEEKLWDTRRATQDHRRTLRKQEDSYLQERTGGVGQNDLQWATPACLWPTCLASFSRTCITGKHLNWQIHLWYPDLFTDNGNKISHSFSRLVSVLIACLAGFTAVVLLLSSWCLIYLGFFSGLPLCFPVFLFLPLSHLSVSLFTLHLLDHFLFYFTNTKVVLFCICLPNSLIVLTCDIICNSSVYK